MTRIAMEQDHLHFIIGAQWARRNGSVEKDSGIVYSERFVGKLG